MKARGISLEELTDAGLKYGITPSNYFVLWDLIQGWQVELMLSQGLRPEHRLLDVGCGALRAGVRFIDYLDEDNYYGIDAYEPYIQLGHDVASLYQVKKPYSLLLTDDFDFPNVEYNYMIAQSVLTHLSLNKWEKLISKLSNCCAAGANFLFTYMLGTQQTKGFLYDGTLPMQVPSIRNDDVLLRIGRKYGASFSRIEPPETHPSGQLVGQYIFK